MPDADDEEAIIMRPYNRSSRLQRQERGDAWESYNFSQA